MIEKTKILIVSKDEDVNKKIKIELENTEFEVILLDEPDMMVAFIKKIYPEVVIADLDKQSMDWLDILRDTRNTDPLIEVIFIGDKSLSSSCVEAVSLGAYDYIIKPINTSKLFEILENIHQKRLIRREIGKLENKLIKKYEFQDMIGRSPQMLNVFSFIRRIAKHPTTVLITGETGTGKELTAKAIHNLSQRKKNRFVSCNCAALAESLLESELFGHVKGAFTGAHQTKYGLFEYGSHGTIFLDEIGDISLVTQTKLLRVLENKEIQRVGSNETIKVDIRILSATNKDLNEAIKNDRFREDLFYRLNVVQIHIPPLRERKEDIPLLSNYFLRKFNKKYERQVKGISQPAKMTLMNHGWPGNIRELENVIERAVSLSTKNFISDDDFPSYLLVSGTGNKNDAIQTDIPEKNITLEELENKYIMKIMERTGGNKVRTAKILGLSRRSLYRKLEKYGEK